MLAVNGIMVKDKIGWLLRVKSTRGSVRKGTYRLLEVPRHDYPDGLFVEIRGKLVDCADKYSCLKVDAIEPAIHNPL